MNTEDQRASMDNESKPKVDSPASGSRIRLRAILLGSGLALAICLITPFNNAYRQGTPLGGGAFPPGTLLFLYVADDIYRCYSVDIQRPQSADRERALGVLGPDGIAFRDRLDRFGTHIFY